MPCSGCLRATVAGAGKGSKFRCRSELRLPSPGRLMRAATSCGQVPWRLPMTILVSRWLAQQPSRLRNEPGHLGGILGVGLPNSAPASCSSLLASLTPMPKQLATITVAARGAIPTTWDRSKGAQRRRENPRLTKSAGILVSSGSVRRAGCRRNHMPSYAAFEKRPACCGPFVLQRLPPSAATRV